MALKHCAALVFATLLGTVAHSEEAGSVDIQIEGETYNFPLWADQSDWTGSSDYASVNIYTRPDDPETWKNFKQFTLGFEIINGNANASEASLFRIVNNDVQKVFAKRDEGEGGLSVNIQSYSISGDELEISGVFEMKMGDSSNYGREIDISSPLDVSGTFDVVLGPIQ